MAPAQPTTGTAAPAESSASSAGASEPSPEPSSHLLDGLAAEFRSTAESVVPWFISQMPAVYFQDTSPAEQREHLRVLIAARASGRSPDMNFRSTDGRSVTAIRTESRSGVLAEILASLPTDASLRSAKIHTSMDGSLVLDTFEFGERIAYDPSDAAQAAKVKEAAGFARTLHPDWTDDSQRAFFDGCAAEYVLTLTPYRLCHHQELFRRVSGTDMATIEIESESNPAFSRITIAVANARTRTMMERVAFLLARCGVSIVRAHLDLVQDAPHGSVTFLAFVIQRSDGSALPPDDPQWPSIRHELQRIKWVDWIPQRLTQVHKGLTLDRAEALVGFAELANQVLVPVNPYAYTVDRLLDVLESHLALALQAVDLFADRFNPVTPLDDGPFASRLASLRAECETRSPDETTATIFRTILDCISAVRRTNYHVPTRCSFALRLDPALLRGTTRPELPFGVFFISGRGFAGFHVRFKEIARGGLRVIRPATHQLYDRESDRLFDEVYGLAWAQQLKNKDIPEGGAKCAIIVDPGSEPNRCVKAFVDGILDLITPEPATKSLILDRLGFQEFIYLGPDENITPAHIEWIVDRAERRGYPLFAAFMSSKPGAGINHKTYGVTSEGVNVFLEVALQARGIDPRKRPFTVKITGGPDGDVAGNMMRILDRDYGANARILGVADGSGVGEDPEGLDHAELLRLFREGLPIAKFDPARLSKSGRVVPITAPDGPQLRNTMHNRIECDAFVPAGGRPATINGRNWRDYLLPDGRPSSPLIVEGANLFLTPEAREHLSRAGATIVKDSSANKCGVICSSYEIVASMLLDEESFLRIKAEFVEQVLVKLRDFARREAMVLLGERKRHPDVPLPDLCIRLSKATNAAADAIKASMEDWDAADQEMATLMVREHIPQVLLDTLGDRIMTALPRPYLEWMVAKSVASRIVYREGIDFFASMETNAIGEVAQRYLTADRSLRSLVSEVRSSGIPHAERIASLLERAGARAALFEG